MISFEVASGRPASVPADVLVLPWFQAAAGGGPVPVPGAGRAAGEVSAALGLDLAATLAGRGFGGAAGETFSTLTLGRLGAAAVLCVGAGPADQAGPAAVRQAALAAGPAIAGYRRAAVVLPLDGPD